MRLTANQRQNPHLQEPRPSLLHQEVAGEADGLMNGAGRAVRLVFRLTVRSQRGPTHRAFPHRPCALTQTCELGLYRVKVTMIFREALKCSQMKWSDVWNLLQNKRRCGWWCGREKREQADSHRRPVTGGCHNFP